MGERLVSAVASIRVSTTFDKQKHSPEFQKDGIEVFGERNGYDFVKFFYEEESAKGYKGALYKNNDGPKEDHERPVLKEIYDFCKKNKSIKKFVVYNSSRYFRSHFHAYKWIHLFDSLGVDIEYADMTLKKGDAGYSIMRAISLISAEEENKVRSSNIVLGMRKSLEQGNYFGKLPRGYWKDKNTGKVGFTDEREVVEKAFRLILSGMKPEAVRVNMKSFGVNLKINTLIKMLQNPFYAGKIRHGLLDKIVEGNQSGMVTWDEFCLVQDKLSNKGYSKGEEDGKTLIPLKKYLVCGQCDTLMTGYYVKKKQSKANGAKYFEKKTIQPYYKCNTKGCGSNVSANKVHNDIEEILGLLTPDEERVEKVKSAILKRYEHTLNESLDNEKIIKTSITKLENKLSNLEERMLEGFFSTPDKYTEACSKVVSEVDYLKFKLKSERDKSNPLEVINYCMELVSKSAEIWRFNDDYHKKTLLNLLFPEGLTYFRKDDMYRTPSINEVFVQNSQMERLEQDIEHKKSSFRIGKLLFCTTVVRGIEESNPETLKKLISGTIFLNKVAS